MGIFDFFKKNKNNSENYLSDNIEGVVQTQNHSDEFDDEQSRVVNESVQNIENEPSCLKEEIQKDIIEIKEKSIGEIQPYDPTKDLSNYQSPPISLLNNINKVNAEPIVSIERIKEILKSYNIQFQSVSCIQNGITTLFELKLNDGVKSSKLEDLQQDFMLALSAVKLDVITMSERGTVGLLIPNRNTNSLSLKSIFETNEFQTTNQKLPIALGKSITNEIFIFDLSKTPHLLIGGASGQGKSISLHLIITSLLYKKHPAELKFLLIDPRRIELNMYSIIKNHFLCTSIDSKQLIISDAIQAIKSLSSLVTEMKERFDLLMKSKTRGVEDYNNHFKERKLTPAQGHRYLPYIVTIIDNLEDLIIESKDIASPILQLVKQAHIVGIHLVISTQRPSSEIISLEIKSNISARLTFKVISSTDSRLIINNPGAEQLFGNGDALFYVGDQYTRLQCAFPEIEEITRITSFIEEQQSYSGVYFFADEYKIGRFEEEEEDPGAIDDFFMDAASLIVQVQQGSTSLIQRKFSLGYNRAGRIMDQLEKFGVVGASAGSKAREVKIRTMEELRELFIQMGLL